MQQTVKNNIPLVLKGTEMGTAKIIPGISGGAVIRGKKNNRNRILTIYPGNIQFRSCISPENSSCRDCIHLPDQKNSNKKKTTN